MDGGLNCILLKTPELETTPVTRTITSCALHPLCPLGTQGLRLHPTLHTTACHNARKTRGALLLQLVSWWEIPESAFSRGLQDAADECIRDAAQAHLRVWCVLVWSGRVLDTGGVRK